MNLDSPGIERQNVFLRETFKKMTSEWDELSKMKRHNKDDFDFAPILPNHNHFKRNFHAKENLLVFFKLLRCFLFVF